jgi:O-acetyl-ADP-ribose deacetylase (regulator of RNase III)
MPQAGDAPPGAARTIGRSRLELVSGDLTRQAVDAIVNAANPSLLGGGGVDGAIHRAGGPAILEECRRLRETAWPQGLPPGEAAITTAGRLPCRFVIHTVGPIWRGGSHDEPRILARCYRACLELSAARGLTSLALPSISTGAYGYPLDEAAPVALAAVRQGLTAASAVTLVRFVLFGDAAYEAYRRALAALE